MPFLARSPFTTLAVRRNCLICSLVRVGWSAAVTKGVQVRHATVARISLRQRKSSMYIGIPTPEFMRTDLPSKPPFGTLLAGRSAAHELGDSMRTSMRWLLDGLEARSRD